MIYKSILFFLVWFYSIMFGLVLGGLVALFDLQAGLAVGIAAFGWRFVNLTLAVSSKWNE